MTSHGVSEENDEKTFKSSKTEYSANKNQNDIYGKKLQILEVL